MNYRKWSIKRRGAYFIFPVIGAALISTTEKNTEVNIYRELSEARTRYAQFNIKYVHLEPGACLELYMYKVSRVSLHQNFRTHELVEVLFLKRYGFDISHKGGALICYYPN